MLLAIAFSESDKRAFCLGLEPSDYYRPAIAVTKLVKEKTIKENKIETAYNR